MRLRLNFLVLFKFSWSILRFVSMGNFKIVSKEPRIECEKEGEKIFVRPKKLFPTIDCLHDFIFDLCDINITAVSISLFMRSPLILNKNSFVDI